MGIIGLISTLLVIAGAGYGGVYWLVKKDTKIENRRRAAAELAGVLRGLGLEKTPAFLIDYSVGDYSGMGETILKLAELFLSGEKAVVEEFDRVFEKCLSAKLKTDAGRVYVMSRVVDAEPDDNPGE